jgi:hypothetical protein
MKLPPRTDEEHAPFLKEGAWVAKVSTISTDGTITITPLTYGVGDGDGDGASRPTSSAPIEAVLQ